MVHDGGVSAEDLENYETEMELAVYRVQRRGGPVLGRGGDRTTLLPGEPGGPPGPVGRRRGVLRAAARRRVGVGRLPLGAVREVRARRDVQGRQRRGAREGRAPALGPPR